MRASVDPLTLALPEIPGDTGPAKGQDRGNPVASTTDWGTVPAPNRRRWRKFLLFGTPLLILIGLLGGASWMISQNRGIPVDGVEVVKSYPHDPQAFSQGLIFSDGKLYEGTGKYGRSTLRAVDLETGTPSQVIDLPENVFGEGIAALNGKIYQLTWQNKIAYVYDQATLKFERTLRYIGEGWGLTTDGKELILSDGTPTLRFLDPETFNVTRTLKVKERNRALPRINELEWVDGEIWANIWYQDFIARISPETGEVVGWIDLRGLYRRDDREAVLNGIAYDAATKRLFVTGKNWPKLYQIKVVPKS